MEELSFHSYWQDLDNMLQQIDQTPESQWSVDSANEIDTVDDIDDERIAIKNPHFDRLPVPKIALEDIRRLDVEYFASDAFIYGSTLQRLECADRMVELKCNRAVEFSEEQLRFASQLQNKRQALTKPKNAWSPSRSRSLELHLRHSFGSNACLIPVQPNDRRFAVSRRRLREERKLTAAMENLLKRSVKQAALDFRKKHEGERFDKFIRKRGFDNKYIKTLEEVLNQPLAEKVYDAMAANNMYRREDSLATLHATGQTVATDNLLALLEDNDSIPLLNIVEWKHETLKKLEAAGIKSAEIDPSTVDWGYVADRMDHFGYHFTAVVCHNLWCYHMDIGSILTTKYILDLAKGTGKDWNKISNTLERRYTEDTCRKMYESYYEKLCDVSLRQLNREQTMQLLKKNWRKLREKFDQTNDTLQHLSTMLNYVFPHLTVHTNDLQRLASTRDEMDRQRKLPHTVIEDALLVVAVVHLKSIIHLEGFSCLEAYLPWRPHSEWKIRLRALARQWVGARFTLQEDMKLLYLVKLLPGNWVDIAKYFDGFDRKSCRGHYIYVRRHLSKGENLLQYHERHGCKRVSCQFPRLKTMISFLLTSILKEAKGGTNVDKANEDSDPTKTNGIDGAKPLPEFKGFQNKEFPTEQEMQSLFYTLNPAWLIRACHELIKLSQGIGGVPRFPEAFLRPGQQKLPGRDGIECSLFNSESDFDDLSDLETKNEHTDSDSESDYSDGSPVKRANFSDTTEVRSESSFSEASKLSQDWVFEPPLICDSEANQNASSESPESQARPSAIPPKKRKIAFEENVREDIEEYSGDIKPKPPKKCQPPKTKKPPGRKGGRLSKLRREVALARWHKTKPSAPNC